MPRRAFYSFHYQPDNWRASQVRNMGVIDGNQPASDNDWESITKGGEKAIQKWIDDQLNGKSVAIVLIGAETAGRKWINYEIKKAWDDRKGVLGIHIHNLKNRLGFQSAKGNNPFNAYTIGGVSMANIVKTYDSTSSDSKFVYAYIKAGFANWIEEAIKIRLQY